MRAENMDGAADATNEVPKRAAFPRGRVFTRRAGLFQLRGAAEGREPEGYSWRKHEVTDCGQKAHQISE